MDWEKFLTECYFDDVLPPDNKLVDQAIEACEEVFATVRRERIAKDMRTLATSYLALKRIKDHVAV